MDIIKNVKFGTLNDYYGSLLTEYQSNIIKMYYDYDMSLAEIAEEEGVTRQAIHDIVGRASKKLQIYEEKLGLINKLNQIKSEINVILESIEKKSKEEIANDISNILGEIREI